MKKNIIIVIFLTFYVLNISSLTAQIKFSDIAQDYKTYFAVPDAPAFNILDRTFSNILRPASVKEIAVAFSSFLDSENKITIPKSFALEFSPGLLINGKSLSISEYNSKKWLYRLRVSAATSRSSESGSATDLALGIRITLNDESDLRANVKYIKEATELSDKIQAVYDEKRLLLGPEATPEQIDRLPDVVAKKEMLINEFVEKWSEEKWNKDISELAFAVKTSTKDSLSKNLNFSKLTFWYSAAYGIGTWGQVLFGTNANYQRVDTDTTNDFNASFSISSRFYCGTNKYKVNIEALGRIIEDKKSAWLLNLGFEMGIEQNIWAEFSAGIETTEGLKNNSLVTDFKLKYGL